MTDTMNSNEQKPDHSDNTENIVQQHMREQKHDFAKDCECERCAEIIQEEKDNRVSTIISKWKEVHPEVPENTDDWTLEQRKYAHECMKQIREIYDF